MRNRIRKSGALIIALSMLMSLFSGIGVANASGLTQQLLQDFSNLDVSKATTSGGVLYTPSNTSNGSFAIVDGKLKLTSITRSGGYFLNISSNNTTKWNSGEGTSALTVDFQLDGATDYIGLAGQMITTDATSHITDYDSGTKTNYGKWMISGGSGSFIKIKENKIIVFDEEFSADIDLNTLHTLDLLVNGDNTFSLYIDKKAVTAKHKIKTFSIRYYYKKSGATSESNVVLADKTQFRGFYDVWLQHYSTAKDSVAYFDNFEIQTSAFICTLPTEIPTSIISTDFSGFTTGNEATIGSWASFTTKTEANVTFESVSSDIVDHTLADKALYIKANEGNTAGGSQSLDIKASNFANCQSGNLGSSILEYDFAFDDNAKAVGIQAYVYAPYNDGKGTTGTYGKIAFGTSESSANGNLVYITPSAVTACGQTVNLSTPLERNYWHSLKLVVNGNNTFSLSIDDNFIFSSGTTMATTNSQARVRYDNAPDTARDKWLDLRNGSASFNGFKSISVFLDSNGSSNTIVAQNGAYFDNIALSATYGKYSEDGATPAPERDYAAQLAAAKEELKLYWEDNSTCNIPLDGYGIYGTEISWVSSNTDAVENDGTVKPKIGVAQTATLTATLSIDGYDKTETKAFKVNIPAVMPYEIDGVKVTGSDGYIDTALVGGKTIKTVSIRNYNSVSTPLTVAIALYEGTNMVDVAIETVSSPSVAQYAYGDITLTKGLTLPSVIDSAHSARVFIFDSKENLKPIAETYTIKPLDENVTVFMAGDSTMTTYTNSTYPQSGWGQELGAYLAKANVTVDNTQPAGGRTARQFIVENRLKYIENNISEGDYIFVQFGHNDAKYSYTEGKTGGMTGNVYINDSASNGLTNRHTGIGMYARNSDGTVSNVDGNSEDNYNYSYFGYLEQYVNVAKKKGANIVLFTSFNRAEADDKNLCGYPAAMRAFAAKRNIPVIDTTATSIELYNDAYTKGETLYTAGNLSKAKDMVYNLFLFATANDARYDANLLAASSYKNGAGDGTHFNIYGSQARAKLAVAELIEAKHPLARYANIGNFTNSDALIDNIIENIPTPYYGSISAN